MFCDGSDGVMDQEAAYLAALGTASTYTIQGDILAIFDAQGNRVAEYRSSPLIGKTWNLAEIQYMNDTTKTPDDPARYTVEFLPDGTVNIKADCNNAGGEYTISGSSLNISITHTTRAACPPDSLSEEFLENLRIAASYQFEGNDLYIATQMDVAILKFTPLP
jgi:heat shock protein HslJ